MTKQETNTKRQAIEEYTTDIAHAESRGVVRCLLILIEANGWNKELYLNKINICGNLKFAKIGSNQGVKRTNPYRTARRVSNCTYSFIRPH